MFSPRIMSALDKEIKAVHVADLGQILDKYGQREDFEEGRMKCLVCSHTVSMDNVGSLRFVDGKIVLTCNTTSCYTEVVKTIMR